MRRRLETNEKLAIVLAAVGVAWAILDLWRS